MDGGGISTVRHVQVVEGWCAPAMTALCWRDLLCSCSRASASSVAASASAPGSCTAAGAESRMGRASAANGALRASMELAIAANIVGCLSVRVGSRRRCACVVDRLYASVAAACIARPR